MLTRRKVEIAIFSKISYMGKWLEEECGCTRIEAYEKLFDSKIIELLKIKETGLYLESVEFIKEAYKIELTKGIEAMLQFIS